MPPSPEWTDFNGSDPGISLLELLALLLTGLLFASYLGRILGRVGLARTTISVEADGSAWREVGDFANAGPEDRVFRLDAETGDVEFGDGVHGRRPSGSVTTSSCHRYGGGAAAVVGVVVAGWLAWSASLWFRWRRPGMPPAKAAG